MPALRAVLARNQRLIGLDPGARTIGVALTDVGLTLATPFGSIKRGKLRENAAKIAAIALKEGAGGLVVGLPLSMDGIGRAGGTGGARLGAGAVGDRGIAGRPLGRAAVVRGGQPVPHRRGRCQPPQARRGGGSHGRRLDAAGSAGCEPVGHAADTATVGSKEQRQAGDEKHRIHNDQKKPVSAPMIDIDADQRSDQCRRNRHDMVQ